jgi:predicted unusual protein kinase regulating ubiquinone biosynthesis (AarF/ABC1/UbiB family)
MHNTARQSLTASSKPLPQNPFLRATAVIAHSVALVGHVVANVERLVSDVTRDTATVATSATALYTDAALRATAALSTMRTAPRVARLVTEVLRLVALYKLRGPSEELHADGARRLHDLCVELRGGVLKLGQLASCRVDLLPPAYIEALSRLQDRVPPLPAATIRARIEAELGAPVDQLFARFDDEAIAAASIAQVHGAQLHDGTEVVVKVQLPGVEDDLAADLAALRFLCHALGDALPRTDLPTILAELGRSVTGELDFLAEADATEAVRADFATDPDVVVPRVHRALSTRRVLVLERLEGGSLAGFLAADDTSAAARDRVLELIVRTYAQQILTHGRFQADAHPGNFFVLPGPRLGLLDFGALATITDAQRVAYARLAFAILQKDTARMAELFATIGFATLDGDPAALERFAELLMAAFRDGAELGDIDPRAQLEAALQVAHQNPVVRLPQEFVLIGRVFASLGGLLVRHQPKISLFATIAPYVARAAA